jgi:hypothetical protein
VTDVKKVGKISMKQGNILEIVERIDVLIPEESVERRKYVRIIISRSGICVDGCLLIEKNGKAM